MSATWRKTVGILSYYIFPGSTCTSDFVGLNKNVNFLLAQIEQQL